MKFRYTLAEHWVKKIVGFGEFANGGTQVTVRTKDGKVFGGILISNCMWVIAARGYDDLPFALDDIEEIFQTDDDLRPVHRRWKYWDDWQVPQGRFKRSKT
jgi:hypothetical protein